jgi:hypothetical protein
MLQMTLGRIKVLGLRKSLSRNSFIERNMFTVDMKPFFVAGRTQIFVVDDFASASSENVSQITPLGYTTIEAKYMNLSSVFLQYPKE